MKLLQALALVSALASPAAADPTCGNVEIRFEPGADNLQIAVWIEDTHGGVVDTPYITRLTGQFGLGNRPGAALLKTDFRWPYGRREMVLPIWAHRRNHLYPKVMMGGVCGYSTSGVCPDGNRCSGDCDDTTIAYHSRVSSYEPFYCSPSGSSRIDVMSCASKGTFSKGSYDPNQTSLYPPRADLTTINPATDSMDALDFAKQNDLVAVSAATPPALTAMNPALTWYPQALATPLPAGDYVAWIELSQESDFNAQHNHPNQADSVSTWNFEGHPFLGQPSVLYAVPFHYDPEATDPTSAIATQYAGYSTWDGSDGNLHHPDGTITTNTPGSGAGRLVDVNDGADVYRVKVVVGGCGPVTPVDMAGVDLAGMDMAGVPDGGPPPPPPPHCQAPEPIVNLSLTPKDAALGIAFASPATGPTPSRFEVRYRESQTPIVGAAFEQQIAGPIVPSVMPGSQVQIDLTGLQASTSYAVAVRALSACGKPSAVVSQVAATTKAQFATLHGCFIATAAFGSPMERSVAALRRFRDQRLLDNPIGQLAVGVYYSFSPAFANAIAGSPSLRALARRALQPIVALVVNN
jgi:hypothetical protein